MNSQCFQFHLLVTLVIGFCAANGMYVIPYGFDSPYQAYGGTTQLIPPTTTTTSTTKPSPSTRPPPTTPLPSTTTVAPPSSSSHRICTKCMKKTSTTIPPTGTPTPRPTPSPTPTPTTKPISTTTSTTTTTTTPKPPTSSTTKATTTKKPTTTSTTITTTTTPTLITGLPSPPPPPKRPEDAYSIKYYHQHNYYYPNDSPITVTQPNKIKANVYIKNVPKAVVPIAENVYMTETCDGCEKLPPPTTTKAPVPRPHVPSYMSYVPYGYSQPGDFSQTAVAADSMEQMYQQPEPAPPRSAYDPRRRLHQRAPINSIRKDILAYLSDPNVLTQSQQDALENGGYPGYYPMLPPNYTPYNDFLEPGKSWLNCHQPVKQVPSSAPLYSLTM